MGLWLLVRGGRRRAALALGGGPAAAALVFLGAHQALYGGVTPYAAGSYLVGGELTVVGSDPDYLGRGAAWWACWSTATSAWRPGSRPGCWSSSPSPLWLARRPRGWAALCPAACNRLAGGDLRRVHDAGLVVPRPPGGGRAARGGAGDRLVAQGGGRHPGITLALGAVGVLAYAWVAVEGALGHIAWVVDLQDTANPLYRAWSAALPDYLDVTAATWVLHWTWAAALVALAVLAARGDGFRRLDLRTRSAGLERLPEAGAGAHAAVHDVDDLGRPRPHEQARADAAPLA